jgi:hypothetical protein
MEGKKKESLMKAIYFYLVVMTLLAQIVSACTTAPTRSSENGNSASTIQRSPQSNGDIFPRSRYL